MAKIEPKTVKLKDGSSVILRSPKKEDVCELINCFKDIFENSLYIVTEHDEFRADPKRQEQWISSFDEKAGSICIIAEHNGILVGNLDFRSNENRKRIAHRGSFGMGVRKGWQSKGLGRLLLEELIAWTKQETNAIEKIELTVLEKNKPAYRLYESLGFQEEGRVFKEVKLPSREYIDGVHMGLFVGEG